MKRFRLFGYEIWVEIERIQPEIKYQPIRKRTPITLVHPTTGEDYTAILEYNSLFPDDVISKRIWGKEKP